MQHYKPSGCPVCGATQTRQGLMVLSVDRTTGISILVPLEYEMELLHSEKQDQIHLVAQLKTELHITTLDLQNRLIVIIQNWWCRKLARRRSHIACNRVELSLWNYKIRKLSKR